MPVGTLECVPGAHQQKWVSDRLWGRGQVSLTAALSLSLCHWVGSLIWTRKHSFIHLLILQRFPEHTHCVWQP